MKSAASILYTYAACLLIPAFASVLYNAHTKAFGLNMAGKTGLIACGASAILAVVFATFLKKGKRWAYWAGLGLAFLLLCQVGVSVFTTLRGVSAGKIPVGSSVEAEYYKAAVFGVLGLFSLSAFMRLFLSSRSIQE